MGGERWIADLAPLSSVRWERVRDDISTAEVAVPTTQCCEVLSDLRTIRHELHIENNGEPVWEGPITRIEYGWDVTRIFAEDVLWAAKRTVIEESYDHSYPNIGDALERMEWLLAHCYGRNEDPWRMMGGHFHRVRGVNDPRTSRVVFKYQMYVWDDFDKYAEDYGTDYVVFNRDIYFWDTQLRWMILPPLDENHLSESPRITDYGNQLGTRGIVTNGRGYAGVSTPSAASKVRYNGAVIDLLTTNEVDGQPGLVVDANDNVVPDPAAPQAPTAQEIAQWTDTAARSVIDKDPSPLSIVVPDNVTLLPGAPWELRDLVPGAWFQVSTPMLCRSIDEWQRLEQVVVTEEAPQGETVQFSASQAPRNVVEPLGPLPPPPGGAR